MTWGNNLSGELGDGLAGTRNNSDVPVAVSGLGEVTAVAAGNEQSLALLSNGTVMAWGGNEFGGLGDGTQTESDVPVQVSGLSGVTAIAAGDAFSLALLSNGTVKSWGHNLNNQLGDGTGKNSEVPVTVSGLSGVVAIAAGGSHSLALLSNGTVMAWGFGEEGQVGNGPGDGSSVPVPVTGVSGVTSIAAGGYHSLALLGTGKVMAWGGNNEGQLGLGSNLGPETCTGHLYPANSGPCSRTPVEVPGLSGVTAVSAGEVHSLALLRNSTVVAWGNANYGQLGDGTTTGPESCGEAPQQGLIETSCSTTPVVVSGLSGVSTVSAGYRHSLASLNDGEAMAWGENESGQLGNGSTTNSALPVSVSGLSEVPAVSGGGSHSMALLGTLGGTGSLSISPPSLPDGTVGQPYSATLTASGGTPPYTWSTNGIRLAIRGLSLNAMTGVISGSLASLSFNRPRAITFTVHVTDATSPKPRRARAVLSVNLLTAQRQVFPVKFNESASPVAAVFSDTGLGTHPSDFTATIDWGDKTTPAAASVVGATSCAAERLPAGNCYEVTGTHKYLSQNSFPFQPKVTVFHGSARVSVTDVAEVQGAGGPHYDANGAPAGVGVLRRASPPLPRNPRNQNKDGCTATVLLDTDVVVTAGHCDKFFEKHDPHGEYEFAPSFEPYSGACTETQSLANCGRTPYGVFHTTGTSARQAGQTDIEFLNFSQPNEHGAVLTDYPELGLPPTFFIPDYIGSRSAWTIYGFPARTSDWKLVKCGATTGGNGNLRDEYTLPNCYLGNPPYFAGVSGSPWVSDTVFPNGVGAIQHGPCEQLGPNSQYGSESPCYTLGDSELPAVYSTVMSFDAMDTFGRLVLEPNSP